MLYVAALVLLLVSVAPAWAVTYHISTTGVDTNVGSAGSPFRTITKCATVAVAGDTCQIGPGVFTEHLTPPTSGTLGNPIVFQGTLGPGNSLDTTIDGSVATSGWTALGSGVWGASLGNPAGLTAAFGGSQRTIWKIDDSFMTGTAGMAALNQSATATVKVAVNNAAPPCGPGNECTINVWDGIEALFGNVTGQTRLRFRNGENPSTMNVRAATGLGVVRIQDKNHLTLRYVNVVGGDVGVEILGTGSNNVIEFNYIRHGRNQVAIHTGSGTNNIVRNNHLLPDSIGAVNAPPGDRNGRTYTRALSRWMYDRDKFLVGTTEIRHGVLAFSGSFTGTQILDNQIGYGVAGMIVYGTPTNMLIKGNTFHHFADIGIYMNADDVTNFQVAENLFYDASHHMRLESMARSHEIYIYKNRFHNVWYGSGGGAGKHIFLPPPGATSPSVVWVYHNTFAGGGWAVDFGGTAEVPGGYCYGLMHVLNNVFSTNGISSGGTGPISPTNCGAEFPSGGNLSDPVFYTNTIGNFLLPVGLRNAGLDLRPRGLPGIDSAYYVDGTADDGAVQGAGEVPPAPTYVLTAQKAGAGTGTMVSSPAGINCATTCSSSFADGTVVTLTATPNAGFTFAGWSGDCSGAGTCVVTMSAARSVTATFAGTASALLETSGSCAEANTLDAFVHGSVFYLPPGASFDGQTAVLSQCTSAVTYTDVVSHVGVSHPTVRPLTFAATGVGLADNTCTDCVSIHSGTPSLNAAGSGWTLTDFREGTSVAAATAGASVYTLLPSLCTKVVEGVVTPAPLWPGGQWPMNQRILDARLLAGESAVDVTATIQGLLGPLPSACTGSVAPTCPPDCPALTTFYVDPDEGVDGTTCLLETPCQTIAYARSLMTAGDTLYLRSGSYTGAANRIDTSVAPFPGGLSVAQPTRIAAYANEVVTLAQDSGVVMTFDNPATDHYLVVDRLTCDGNATPTNDTQCLVVGPGAHHLRFQNMLLQNTHGTVATITDASAIEILDSRLTGGTHAGGLRIVGASDSVLLDNVRLDTHTTFGIDAQSANTTNLTLRRVTLDHNTGTGLVTQAARLTAHNLLAHHNGVGVHLLDETSEASVAYATIADNIGPGLQIEAGATNTRLTNVLVFGNGSELVDRAPDTTKTTILLTNPGFVGGGNYRMASPSSPAIDAGTCLPGVVTIALDGVDRPQPAGGACDIGVFEQAGSGPPAPGALSATPIGSTGFFGTER